MAIRKWIVPALDTEAAAVLAEECELNPFLALLLTTRGVKTPEDATAFLLGNDADDPFMFADMDAAVERISRAIDSGENIMVYGDYDVDGITATTLLFSYLQEQGANVQYRLPTREGDGYGLHNAVIDEFAAKDISLLVTVDNGITAVEEVAYAAQKGIDVVVTDHHQPQDVLPAAVAVVDPHRADCPSGCVNYAGVGVAYMLVCALEGDPDAVMEKYGDLVALGTLADVMPLVGTTRSLVRNGLQVMNHLRRPGIKALVEIAGMLDKELTATRVVFTLAPRLNAAGRMHDPLIAVKLLLEQDYDTARVLAEEVQACNVERQAAEAAILKEIDTRLRNNPQEAAARVLVIDGVNWPVGVIGILAARLTERYGKPSIVLSVKDGIAKGSGRSIAGFSLFDALSAVEDTAITFGGHE
ncbi:MAG: single-stranded-DNA-specific exonuclease RecJ, partial [Clostridia bacterium]|nr:single-stranded-DNA-specific exonuclease RecJ [Clostridia bacterium]